MESADESGGNDLENGKGKAGYDWAQLGLEGFIRGKDTMSLGYQ